MMKPYDFIDGTENWLFINEATVRYLTIDGKRCVEVLSGLFMARAATVDQAISYILQQRRELEDKGERAFL
jgi:hypothetical protein